MGDNNNTSSYALGSLSNATNNAVNIFATEKQNRKQRKFDKEMAYLNNFFATQAADKAWARENEMWNKNNAYNSASAQVDRLKQAGLNPALAMSGGAIGSPATSHAPAALAGSGHANSSKPISISDPLDDVMRMTQIKNVEAQTKNVEADTAGKEEDNKTKPVMRELTTQQIRNLEQDYDFHKISYEHQEVMFDIAETLQSLEVTNKNLDMESKSYDLVRKDQDIKRDRKLNSIRQEQAETDLDFSQKNNSLLLQKLRSDLEILGITKDMKKTNLKHQEIVILSQIVKNFTPAGKEILGLLKEILPFGAFKELRSVFIKSMPWLL